MSSINKRGLATFPLMGYIFTFLFIALTIGILLLIFVTFDSALDVDIAVGQVNLQTVNNQTLGQVTGGFVDQADNIGIAIIFGTVLTMLFSAFFFSKNESKIWIVIDIFILVFAFILAVYVSQTYDTLINASAYLDVFINDIPNTSKFILNLPLYVGGAGALMMILSYAGLRRQQQIQEQEEVLGF